jgi:hypothetical protein
MIFYHTLVSLLLSVALGPGDEFILTARINSPYRQNQNVILEPSAHFSKKYEVLPENPQSTTCTGSL